MEKKEYSCGGGWLVVLVQGSGLRPLGKAGECRCQMELLFPPRKGEPNQVNLMSDGGEGGDCFFQTTPGIKPGPNRV